MAGKSLKGNRHAHGCIHCHVRYEDACERHEQDGMCTQCRGGRPWQMLIENASPQQCCVQLSRLATKDERTTYRLAGKHLWFICRACKRTHPFDPKRSQE